MSMRTMSLEHLTRRVLSEESEANPAIRELCSRAKENPQISVDLVPILLDHLSKRKRPLAVAEHGDPLDRDLKINTYQIFRTVYIAVLAGSEVDNVQLTPVIRKLWPAIHFWCSFLVTSYIEPDSIDHGRLCRTGLEVLQTLLMLFFTLLMKDILRTQEFQSIPDAPHLLVCLQLHHFFIDPSTALKYRLPEISSGILDQCHQGHWDMFWKDVYIQGLQLFHRHVPTAARILSQLSQQRPQEYHLLEPWLHMLSSIALISDDFNGHLLPHRFVYLITRILRHISTTVSRHKNDLSCLDEHLVGTWRWCLKYLILTFQYGGYESIRIAIDSGLLEALWTLSQIAVRHCSQICESLAPLSEELIGEICAWSLYRSVQKPVELLLKKAPLNKIPLESESSTTGAVLPIWSRFRTVFERRIKLRLHWELNDHALSFCSYPECESQPRSKMFRCSQCKIAFYCSRVCQKYHWRQNHRQECQNEARDQQDAIPRKVEDRDYKLIQSIVQSELWSFRSFFWQQQTNYRNAINIICIPTTHLVNCVDLTVGAETQMTVGPLDQCRQNNPSDAEERLDKDIRRMEEEQREGLDVGPIVSAKIPHPGEKRVMFMYAVLRKPDV